MGGTGLPSPASHQLHQVSVRVQGVCHVCLCMRVLVCTVGAYVSVCVCGMFACVYLCVHVCACVCVCVVCVEGAWAVKIN